MSTLVYDVASSSKHGGRRVIVASDANGSSKPNGVRATINPAYVLFVVTNSVRQNSGGRRGIVQTGANREPSDSGQSDTANRGFTCRNCGQALKRKSRNGRLPVFCSARCRVTHWRKKQRGQR